MWTAAVCFVLLNALFLTVSALPTQLDDIFAGYVKNVNLYNSEKQSQVLKRQAYDNNQDAGLKMVSLQSLIGDLEQDFFKSASSVSKLTQQLPGEEASSPVSVESHSLRKRTIENTKKIDEILHHDRSDNSDEKTTTIDSIEKTTEPPATKSVDRTRIHVEQISVQPHFGDLPVVPAFQLRHTTFNEPGLINPTKITITKTNIQTPPIQESSEKMFEEHKVESKVQENLPNRTEENRESHKPSTEQPDDLVLTTSKKSVEELKETEAELKEKVAEIEAEPVILSARV